MRDTLRTVREELAGRVALAHLDPATGDIEASRALAAEIAPLIVPLLRPCGVLVSEPAIDWDGLSPTALPEGVAPGRYHLYRRVSCRSPA
jgi:hypothetical protein